MEYKYSNQNLFEKTEKYQMSSFEGKEFLSSYEISRLSILKKIQINNDNSKIFEILYKEKTKSVKEIITEPFFFNNLYIFLINICGSRTCSISSKTVQKVIEL